MRGHNLPQTFERRGTTVPFQQKDLAHARVREYFHGENRLLEAVIPNLSGTRRGELVVVPWDSLPSQFTLETRDAKVHGMVAGTRNTRDLDPINIRDICLKADIEHGGDGAARERALEIAEQDRSDKSMVRLSCIAQLTRECGIAKGDPLMARADTRTLMQLMGGDSGRSKIDLDLLIERVMIFAAERSSTTVEGVKDYLDPLVGMITPFGNVTAEGEQRSNGFLYQRHTALIAFRKQANTYRPMAREELQSRVDDIIAAADECIDYVNERLTTLNEMMGRLADMFDQNLGVIDTLDRLRRDVGYGLDGWEDMITVWNTAYANHAAIGGEQAMERTIGRISSYAPRIPVKELFPGHEQVKSGSQYEKAKVKMVSTMHAWDTGQLDSELHARVEKGNKPHGGAS